MKIYYKIYREHQNCATKISVAQYKLSRLVHNHSKVIGLNCLVLLANKYSGKSKQFYCLKILILFFTPCTTRLHTKNYCHCAFSTGSPLSSNNINNINNKYPYHSFPPNATKCSNISCLSLLITIVRKILYFHFSQRSPYVKRSGGFLFLCGHGARDAICCSSSVLSFSVDISITASLLLSLLDAVQVPSTSLPSQLWVDLGARSASLVFYD